MTGAEATALVDEAWQLLQELDDHTPMWTADMDQLARWPSTSEEHTTAGRVRLMALQTRLEVAAEDAEVDGAASLLTAANGLALVAGQLAVQPEIGWAHPRVGWHGMLFWSTNDHALVTAEHGVGFVDKITRLGPALDELRARLGDAAAQDRAPLASHSAAAVARLDEHLGSALADDPLLQQAPPSELGETAIAAWRDDLATAVRDHARPALQRLRDTLADVSLPAGRDDDHPGLVHRPDGPALYVELLRAYGTPDATPEQVHATGLEQLARLDEEWAALGAAELGIEDPAAVREHLRRDTSLRYASTEELVAAATELHARAVARAPAAFRRVPEAPCEVRATEHGSLAFYTPPTEDGSRPGAFYFNTSDPTQWGVSLASTVFHEGVPGHHFQLALGIESPHLHPIHRESFLPAFGEGWALYAERVADELGLYRNGLDRLGMVATDAMRASRLVVDTGLHHLGWSRQRAIDTMVAQTPLDVEQVAAEIDRYVGMPGQATSYMTGRLAIDAARAAAERRLGADFDLPTFHEAVLARGMLSLPALARVAASLGG